MEDLNMKHITILLFTLFFLNPNTGLADEPVVIRDIEIAKKTAEETDTKLLLVFGADWCKYCIFLEKDLMRNIEEIEGYTVCYVDFDTQKDLVRKYGVSSIPKSVVLNGDSIKTKVGYRNFDNYKLWLGL